MMRRITVLAAAALVAVPVALMLSAGPGAHAVPPTSGACPSAPPVGSPGVLSPLYQEAGADALRLNDDGSTCTLSDLGQAAAPDGGTDPLNPGDLIDCADFGTRSGAQGWFDFYRVPYGDVAHLDADGDGIACEELS